MDGLDLFDRPYSMLFIFLVNVCVVLTGSLIFRFTVNVKRLEAQEFEVRSYDRVLREAKRKNDKAVLRKLKREEVRIKRISKSASKQRLKVVMITILPFTAVSLVLGILYARKDVALFPFEFPLFNKDDIGRTVTPFYVWYSLAYLSAYLPLSRIFRSAPSYWQSYEVKSS